MGEPHSPDERFIDVFGGGRVMTRDECLDLIRAPSVAMTGDCLESISLPQTYQRMCANLVSIFRQVPV